MAIEPFDSVVATTRDVLANVTSSQLDDATPCALWSVGELIDHIVGGPGFFADALEGVPMSTEETNYSSGDFRGAFDANVARCRGDLEGPHVMTTTYSLPFGEMNGTQIVALASLDMFTHAWDLAKATGQETNLAPALAAQLLEGARAHVPDAIRNDAGSPFAFERSAPASASAADQLAAFLGRTI